MENFDSVKGKKVATKEGMAKILFEKAKTLIEEEGGGFFMSSARRQRRKTYFR